MALNPVQDPSKKPLIIIIILLVLLLLYLFFWLNFFGVYKPSFIPKKSSLQSEQQKKIENLIKDVKTIDKPLDPEIKQDAHVSRINTIERALTQAEEALAKGELDKARALLKDVDSLIFIMGATRESIPFTEEEFKTHDPKKKYLTTRNIDPKVKNIYLQVIDLMVETDKDY